MLNGFALSTHAYMEVGICWDEVCVVVSVELVDGMVSLEIKTWLKSGFIKDVDFDNFGRAGLSVLFTWFKGGILFGFLFTSYEGLVDICLKWFRLDLYSSEDEYIDGWGKEEWGDKDRLVLSGEHKYSGFDS